MGAPEGKQHSHIRARLLEATWSAKGSLIPRWSGNETSPKAPHEVRCSASGGRHTVQKGFGLGTTRGGPVV